MSETLKDRLAKALREHDWYFQMSDDSRIYHRGIDQQRRIDAMFSKLREAEGDREALLFWNEHVPESRKRSVPEEES